MTWLCILVSQRLFRGRYVHAWSSVHRSSQRLLLAVDRSSNSNNRAIAPSSLIHMASSKNDDLTSLQKSVSQRHSASQSDYLQHQKQVFDELADWFASDDAISPHLVPVYQYVAQSVLKHYCSHNNNDSVVVRILDVACGTGALFLYLVQQADAIRSVKLDLTGVDVSPRMVQKAQQVATELMMANRTKQHSIQVVQSDIAQLQNISDNIDVIVANACFGNFWDQRVVLDRLCGLLSLRGRLFVTHPLGAAFVQQLHEETPEMVRHLLPTRSQWESLIWGLPLRTTVWEEQVTLNVDGKDELYPIYIVSAQKIRCRGLSRLIRLRGKVDQGFGRGGKKLGFPTANLPSKLFQDALEDVETGVYFGWALLEGDTKGRNHPHKAVVNVGYSPTFEGQENPEKIVEAHLILDPEAMEPPDFYGETMRLQLHGYIRPEMKFPSFPALIEQIASDRDDSREALEFLPYSNMSRDPFLAVGSGVWVGKSGGNDSASWEFADARQELESFR